MLRMVDLSDQEDANLDFGDNSLTQPSNALASQRLVRPLASDDSF